MAYGEPLAVTQARRQKAAEQFPVLNGSSAGDAIQVDNWASQQGTPPSDFTQVATRIGAQAAQSDSDVEAQQYDANAPDAVANVTGFTPPTGANAPPWTSVAHGSQDEYQQGIADLARIRSGGQTQPEQPAFGGNGIGGALRNLGNEIGGIPGAIGSLVKDEWNASQEQARARTAQLQNLPVSGDALPTPSIGDWLSNAAGVNDPTKTTPLIQTRGPELGALTQPANLVGLVAPELSFAPEAGPIMRVLTDIAANVAGGVGGAKAKQAAKDAGLPEWAQELAGLGAGFLVGGAAGTATAAAPRAAGMFDRFITPAELPAEARQVGRVAGTDSLFTAGPNGEVVGPTGNVAELRLGREPVMGEDVNAGLRRTAYGRAQQEALTADEQAAFRSEYERTIAGAEPPTGEIAATGGAERAPFTPETLQALIDEKKGAGLTAEQILADEDVQAAQRQVFGLGTPKDFNAPENLGGGQGLSAEQQANVSGTVQRAGQLNTVRDSLANAREVESAPPLLEQRALDRFGTTTKVNHAGYVLYDGRMLNFSDASGARAIDHNAVGDLLTDAERGYTVDPRSGPNPSLDKIAFQRQTGAMRIRPENNGVEIVGTSISEPQFKLLQRLIRADRTNGLTIDVTGGIHAPYTATAKYADGLEAILRNQGVTVDRGYVPPSALDSVIARNADTLPEPTRTQPPPGYLERFRQPPAGGADIPGSQPPIVPRGGTTLPTGRSVTPQQVTTGDVRASLARDAVTPLDKSSLLDQVVDVANAPRSILTSFDLSAPFRQGAMLVGHPREFFGNLKPMLEAFASKDAAETVDAAIRGGSRGAIKDQAGLYLSPLDNATASLTQREEAYMSRLTGKVAGVAGSQRAYATFLNKTRSDVFDHFWESLPLEAQTIENAQRYAHFINAATGRGSIPAALKDLAPALNAAFFSPRYFVSRFESNGMGVQALADVAKGVATRQSLDPVSKQIAGDVLKFYAAGASALTMAAAAGANVELDPRSSDFGKIKVGDTRYDIWAGNQQIARFIAQEASGKRNSGGTVSDVGRNAVALNFLRSKLAPLPGLAWDTLKGTTPTGDKVDATPAGIRRILFNEFVPMIAQDLISGAQDAGAVGAVKTLPTILGVGTQTYAPTEAAGTARRPTRSVAPRPARPSR